MSQRPRKQEAGHTRPADLSVFPLDQGAIQRLAMTLTSEQLKENRLATANAIMVMLETVFKEIDKMERLASKLEHAPASLINDIIKMREAAKKLYAALGDSFRWA